MEEYTSNRVFLKLSKGTHMKIPPLIPWGVRVSIHSFRAFWGPESIEVQQFSVTGSATPPPALSYDAL